MSTRHDEERKNEQAVDDESHRDVSLDVHDASARLVDDEDLDDTPVVDITDESNAAWTREDDQFVPPSSMDPEEFREFVAGL